MAEAELHHGPAAQPYRWQACGIGDFLGRLCAGEAARNPLTSEETCRAFPQSREADILDWQAQDDIASAEDQESAFEFAN